MDDQEKTQRVIGAVLEELANIGILSRKDEEFWSHTTRFDTLAEIILNRWERAGKRLD